MVARIKGIDAGTAIYGAIVLGILWLSAVSNHYSDSRISGIQVCVDASGDQECMPLETFRERERKKSEAYNTKAR